MDRNRFIKWLGVLLAVLVVCACSKEGNDHYEGIVDNMYNNPNEYYIGIDDRGIYANESYTGLWSIGYEIVDSADVTFMAKGKDHPYLLDFSWFPYKAIAKLVAPDVNVSQIQYLGNGSGSPSDSLLIKMFTYLGLYADMTYAARNPTNFLRFLGRSKEVFYFELYPNKNTSPFLYLPFVVTTDKGEVIGIIPAFSYTDSMVILDYNMNNSFSCVLTIPQIEVIRNGVTELKQLSPELKLKYTSIKQIDRKPGGN